MAVRQRKRIREFRLTGVQETGTVIGKGIYADVIELQFRGLKCAGKRLYPRLCGSFGVLQRFEEECAILGLMRHPNIVQFLGVTFEDGTELPTLVMEFMHTTLTSCIDRYGLLPQEVSYSILGDVATALCFLHGSNPQIIHRHLTANNMLLTRDMQAKISDLLVAKILSLTPARIIQMTNSQSIRAYMPPEALESNPPDTTSIDSFSYGVTIVHLLSGKLPMPCNPSSQIVVDPLNPKSVLTEAQRREEYLTEIGTDHKLMILILECLQNEPHRRPNTYDILQRVQAAAREHQPAFEDKVAHIRADTQGQKQPQDYHQENEMKELAQKIKLQQLERQKNNWHKEREYMKELLETRNKELKSSTSNALAKYQEITAMRQLVDAKTEEVKSLAATLKEKEKEIDIRQRETELKQAEIDKLRAESDLMLKHFASENQQHLSDQMMELLASKNQIQSYPQLEWTTGADMPAGMSAPQHAIIDSDIYVGGGQTHNQEHFRSVFRYSTAKNKWYTLSLAPHWHFGLVGIHRDNKKRITIVGGVSESTLRITGKVFTYYSEEGKWVHSLPLMPTPRSRVCAVGNEFGIIACGGEKSLGLSVDTVELYLYETKQWQSAASLPAPRAALRSAVIENRTYFMGGYSKGHILEESSCSVMSVDDGQKDCCYYTHPECANSMNRIADTPLADSAPVNMHGVLMALGGRGNSSGIHIYETKSKEWIRTGDLPESLCAATAAMLPTGKLVLFGGQKNDLQLSCKVFIAQQKSL